jgi:hypothetical protein
MLIVCTQTKEKPMQVYVYLVSGLLIITKLADIVTTLQGIRTPSQEKNPYVGFLMKRIGIQKAVWIVSFLVLLIIGISAIAALKGGTLIQALFIVLGTIISFLQAAVAYANRTQRSNLFTRPIAVTYLALSRVFRK